MARIRCIGLGIAVIVLFFAAGTAMASISPAGCTANNLNVNFSKDQSQIVSGDTVHYTITISNGGAGGCDISDTDVVFHCPGADGNPLVAGVTLTTTGNFPVDGSGNTCWNFDGSLGCTANAGLACVVTVNAGVTQATARVNVGQIGDITKGALHDAPTDDSFDASKNLAVTVVECLTVDDCNDSLFCTDDACVSNVCQHTAHSCPADSDLCTTESCDETANACVSSQPPSCDDADICTDDSCVPATGLCQHTFDETNDPSCSVTEFCRTPGFWGTHADADPDKACSQDITSAVIAAAGGSITICGETLTAAATTAPPPPNGNASSAIEAMCVRVQGQPARQLARQLTAARLNCIVSGETGGACDGVSVNEVFDLCNAACPADIEVTIGSDTVNCIDALDCFNNGGQFDNATGVCTTGTCSVGGADCSEDNPCAEGECIPLPNNCHNTEFADVEFPLPNDSLPASNPCFEKQGPAGSDDECKAANKSTCTIIPPGESLCSVQ
jgi:hypothetical protein